MSGACQWRVVRRERDGRGRYQCSWCGAQVSTRYPAEQIRGPDCVARALGEATQSVPRGLGDTVARWLGRWGIRAKAGCGCRRRQAVLNRWWPYRHTESRKWPNAGRVMLRFPHGFGDTVQLIVVLRHLQRLRPDWQVDVACKTGTGSLLQGHCQRVVENLSVHGKYDRDVWLPWPEPVSCYEDSPSTKAERCLREQFGLQPQAELTGYPIHVSAAARQRARAYVAELPAEQPMALLHYQGNSARERKTLDERIVAEICQLLWRRGLQPVVLDWETPRRSHLIDGVRVLSPGAGHALWQGAASGDGETLAALAMESALNIGIDSGPGHVFASESVQTPAVIVWRGHHPLHYFQPTAHVCHVLPRQHERLLRGTDPQRQAGLRYFQEHYRYHECARHVRYELPMVVENVLDGIGASSSVIV